MQPDDLLRLALAAGATQLGEYPHFIFDLERLARFTEMALQEFEWKPDPPAKCPPLPY